MNYMKLAVRRRRLPVPLLFSGSSGPLGRNSFAIMKTLLAIVAMIFLSLSSYACYTIIKSIPVGLRTDYNQQYFSSEVELIPELLDEWVQRTPAPTYTRPMTRGEETVTNARAPIGRVLSFYTSGKVTFCSEFESRHGVTHNDRYRVFADTLVVYFEDKSDIEKYVFVIYGDQLTLTGLWKFEYASYTLTASNSSVYDRYQSE